MEEQIGEGRGRPRRKNDPAGMRSRILGAAYELFQLRGYNAASVQEVASVAGVTGGGLSPPFPPQQALRAARVTGKGAGAPGGILVWPAGAAPRRPAGRLPGVAP